MSIHRSLVVKSTLMRARNVWTRLERIEKLEENEKFGEDQSIFGLPKVRTRFKVKGTKAKKEGEGEGAAEVEAGAETEDNKSEEESGGS